MKWWTLVKIVWAVAKTVARIKEAPDVDRIINAVETAAREKSSWR